MTTIIGGNAQDGFTAVITLLDGLSKPDVVRASVEQIREESAKSAEALKQLQAAQEAFNLEKAALDERAKQVEFREQQVKMAETDALKHTEQAKRRTADVEALEKEFEGELAAKTVSLEAREKALSLREEQLQADTARISEAQAARELNIANKENLADTALAEAEQLRKTWQTRIDTLRQQVELAQQA